MSVVENKDRYKGKFTSVVFECLHKAACTVCCMTDCLVCEVKTCTRARDNSGGISAL